MATSPSPSPQNWFHPQPVLPASHEVGQAHLAAQDVVAEHQVIERVCALVAPSWARVCTAPLTMGRTAIWIEPADEAAAQPMPPEQYRRQAGIAYDQMAHELSLIGWRTDADDRVLLVLGWSTEQLWGRASLLQLALTQELADVEPTVAQAIRITTMVVAEQAKLNRQPSIGDVAVETSRRIATQLRWPSRLAALAGLERVSTLRAQQYAFTQIAGLEAKVAARCEEHLAVARLVAYHLCERLQQGVSSRQACQDVLAWAVSRLHAGTSEAEQGKSEMVRLVVSRLCERLEQGVDDHQAGQEVLAWAVSRLNASTAEGEPTASAGASPSPEPSRGLVERFIGASVPNHPIAPEKELPPDRTMPTGPLHAL